MVFAIVKYLINKSNLVINHISLRYYKVGYSDFQINGILKLSNSGMIRIDGGFKCNSGNKYNLIGGDRKCSFIVSKNAELLIGRNVGISNSTIVCTMKITIEDSVFIGGGCRLWDTDFHSINPYKRTTGNEDDVKHAPIYISKRAFIGGGTIILKGVTVGENSIVAAGSVVSKTIPPNEIWGGNPARFIRALTKDELHQDFYINNGSRL